MRVFYLYAAMSQFYLSSKLAPFLMSRQDELLSGLASDLFWWLRITGIDLGLVVLFTGSVLVSFSAVLFVGSRVLRLTNAVLILHTTWWWWLFVVDMHDADKYAITFVSFALALAPAFPSFSSSLSTLPRRDREVITRAFVGAQAALMLCYSMAGFAKLRYTVGGDLHGGYGVLFPYGLSVRMFTHITKGYHSPEIAPLADVMGRMYLLTWGGTLFFFVVQLLALCVVLLPSLHRAWGLALIGMHLMICVTFNIHYFDNIMLLFILMVLSPFGAFAQKNLLEIFAMRRFFPLIIKGELRRAWERLLPSLSVRGKWV